MPMLKQVDAVLVRVPSIDEGLAFYLDVLGQDLVWRRDAMAAVRLGDSELVLSTELDPETDLLVESVLDAVELFATAGGSVLLEPEAIDVGMVAVVADPFGNRITLVDLSRGRYETDEEGNITGVT